MVVGSFLSLRKISVDSMAVRERLTKKQRVSEIMMSTPTEIIGSVLVISKPCHHTNETTYLSEHGSKKPNPNYCLTEMN